MSCIIKTYNEGTPIYFHKLCRRVYQQEKTPAFRGEIEDAYVFDSVERAERMKSLILERYPDIKLEIEQLSLRGPDGFVPLENTVNAMLSEDFRHRLWAEYEQLNTRRHKLKEYRKKLMESDDSDPLEVEVVTDQIDAMHTYMIAILDRCRLFSIDLAEVEKEIK